MSRTLQVSTTLPGAYPVLREALLDAPAGATIVIGPGTYEESVDFQLEPGLDMTLVAGAGGDVILSGRGGYDSTIRCRGGALTLKGLTIRSSVAGGVEVISTKLTMDKCTIEAGYGAGIKATDRSELRIRDTAIKGAQQGLVIEDCSGTVDAVTITDSADDAIVLRLGADPILRECVVTGAGHRGVYAYQSAKPTLEGCEISGTGDTGISIAHGSSAILTRCHVHDTRGVGISFEAGTDGEVNACKVEETAAPAVQIAEKASVTVRDEAGVGTSDTVKGDPKRVEELLAELDEMVGLSGVKAEVKSIIDEIQVQEWRRSAGLNVGGMSNHLIFAGAPGTGKTTVGRIYGQLLAALGVLPGGPLREVSRRDLVGQYFGHTAEKTAIVFEEAKGGVVFLDEAYTLSRTAGSGNADFGQEAIDMIVKLMEDWRNDIAVIAAGYTKEMLEFLDANPGLASRFVKTIEFENYSGEDLTLITKRMINSGDYRLADDAEPILLHHFSTVERGDNFGNARDARKLFELLRKVQSQRLRTLSERPTLHELQLLTADDIKLALKV
ncbi:MAG: right-handed parallel beta-helix repeat-containing protein [Geodermatophilaceae bacterium]|nr:right-handed parallel beta-helix repeat-containing protein [Geodermatophilaceae bacterium]